MNHIIYDFTRIQFCYLLFLCTVHNMPFSFELSFYLLLMVPVTSIIIVFGRCIMRFDLLNRSQMHSDCSLFNHSQNYHSGQFLLQYTMIFDNVQVILVKFMVSIARFLWFLQMNILAINWLFGLISCFVLSSLPMALFILVKKKINHWKKLTSIRYGSLGLI